MEHYVDALGSVDLDRNVDIGSNGIHDMEEDEEEEIEEK